MHQLIKKNLSRIATELELKGESRLLTTKFDYLLALLEEANIEAVNIKKFRLQIEPHAQSAWDQNQFDELLALTYRPDGDLIFVISTLSAERQNRRYRNCLGHVFQKGFCVSCRMREIDYRSNPQF